MVYPEEIEFYPEEIQWFIRKRFSGLTGRDSVV